MKQTVKLEKYNAETDAWETFGTFHTVRENITGAREYSIANTEFTPDMVTLTFRWSKKLAEIFSNTQLYRAIYTGETWDVVQYDDPMFRHQFAKLICRKVHA